MSIKKPTSARPPTSSTTEHKVLRATELPDVIGYLDPLLLQCAMPYRPLEGNPTTWRRESSHFAVEMVKHPAIKGSAAGVPYGAYGRLLIAALLRIARATRSPTVPLEGGARRLLQQLGVSIGGEQLRAIQDQAARVATVDWRIFARKPDGAGWCYLGSLLDGIQHAHDGAWPTAFTLSPFVYDRLVEHSAPIDMQALQSLSGSARAMDIYCFLACQLYRIPIGKPMRMPLIEFAALFEYNLDAERENLLKTTHKALQRAVAAYPQAVASVSVERDQRAQGRPMYVTLRSAKPANTMLG